MKKGWKNKSNGHKKNNVIPPFVKLICRHNFWSQCIKKGKKQKHRSLYDSNIMRKKIYVESA